MFLNRLADRWRKKAAAAETGPDDFPYAGDHHYIVSFPKSGTTWMRFIVGNLISREPVDFVSVQEIVPPITGGAGGHGANTVRGHRFFSTHRAFDPRLGRVVYVVRDPRSVAVSYFFYSKKYRKIPGDLPFRDYLPVFLDGGSGEFGAWPHHVGSWLGAREGDRDFLVVRYEDLLKDTAAEIARLNNGFDLGFGEREIRAAIEKSSFSAMRKAEVSNPIPKWKNARKDIPFIRKGDVNEWKSYFDDRALDRIPSEMRRLMESLGYRL